LTVCRKILPFCRKIQFFAEKSGFTTEKGKHKPRAKEAVYVGFVPNMSAWAFWVPKDKKIMTTNQVRFIGFNEHEFPFRKRKMVEQ
jgi:hypothetical protein